MELYLKYRPQSFKEVVGQKEAIKSLNDMGKRGEIPHALLFTGPSGTGKTTLARILKRKLKCSDHDFIELNAASDARGIETIRKIQSRMGALPLGGKCRIWLLDEVHQLTGDAQNGMLKLLEDFPSHVYFFLATTDPNKLKKTIRTRCTEIACNPVSEEEIKQLVQTIVGKEEVSLDEAVSAKIAEVVDGSARKALVLLHSVIGLNSTEEQLAFIQKSDTKRQAIEIARALVKEKTTWKEMAQILKNVDEDPEQLRWMVLGYASKVLLNNPRAGARCALIIEEFREPWYGCGRAGLDVSCWNVINGSD